MAKKDDVDLPFEKALAQLEAIVGQIASGKVALEESLAMYEKGMDLVRRCRAILERAEKRLEILSAADGVLHAAPMPKPAPADQAAASIRP